MKALANVLRRETPHLVATTACAPLDESGRAIWYGGSDANPMTVHLDRTTSGEGGLWRPCARLRSFAAVARGRFVMAPLPSPLSDDVERDDDHDQQCYPPHASLPFYGYRKKVAHRRLIVSSPPEHDVLNVLEEPARC